MRSTKALLFVGVMCVSLFVILLSFHLFVYNGMFYDWQYTAQGTYDLYGYDETWAATHELWDFMLYKGDFYSDFFSERDKLHMYDVRRLICALEYLFFFSGLGIFLILFLMQQRRRKKLRRFGSSLCLWSAFCCSILVGASALLALTFQRSFYLFHHLVFSNDLWLLDPRVDSLIVLFPNSFFQNIFVCMILVTIFFVILLFLLGFLLRKKHI